MSKGETEQHEQAMVVNSEVCISEGKRNNFQTKR